MRIDRHGETKIRLTGWAGPDTPARCKAIGGGRFHSDESGKYWLYPLDLSVCRAARAQFGSKLEIGEALNAWAWVARAAEDAQNALSTATDAELALVPTNAPALDRATRNRTYQRAAIKWAASLPACLIGDQPGLGKSIETLGAVIEATPADAATQFHLILCPSTAISSVWGPEVVNWLPESSIVLTLDDNHTLAEREGLLRGLAHAELDGIKHVFVVINIESVRIRPGINPETGKRELFTTKASWHASPLRRHEDRTELRWEQIGPLVPSLFTRRWDHVVVDESQRALIKRKGAKSQQRVGMVQLRSRRRIALSGTPMWGKPEQLWGTLNWLRPDLYTSYWGWVDRYFERTSNGYSEYLIDGFQIGGADRLAEDLRSIMIRRTKAEVLPELPPKQYAGRRLIPGDDNSPIAVWLTPDAKHLKQYESFAEDASLDFGEDELIAVGPLAQYTRKLQLSSAVHEMRDGRLIPTTHSVKYEWIKEFLSELGGERVVIASRFTQLIDCWAAGFREEGYNVHVLTGKTSNKKRAAMRDDFQSDNPSANVFMLNTTAGGVAITLDMADYLILIDETTIPDEREQVEDRVHRTSRIHNVTIYALACLGTQDEEIGWVAATREDVARYLLDGTRGIDYARKLYEEKCRESDHNPVVDSTAEGKSE